MKFMPSGGFKWCSMRKRPYNIEKRVQMMLNEAKALQCRKKNLFLKRYCMKMMMRNKWLNFMFSCTEFDHMEPTQSWAPWSTHSLSFGQSSLSHNLLLGHISACFSSLQKDKRVHHLFLWIPCFAHHLFWEYLDICQEILLHEKLLMVIIGWAPPKYGYRS